MFTPDGDYFTEWPDVYMPADIYVDRAGLICVSDEIPRLTAVTADGAMVDRCRPSPNIPHDIYGDSKGNLFITETYEGKRVQKFAYRGLRAR